MTYSHPRKVAVIPFPSHNSGAIILHILQTLNVHKFDESAKGDLTRLIPFQSLLKARAFGDNVSTYVLNSLVIRLTAFSCLWACHRTASIICNPSA